MSSIPIYDASEFLSSRDDSGIIGFGSFGRVRDCFHRKLGRVAVKCFGIQGTAQDAEELRQKLSTEAEILQNINHQSIVQCQGVTVWSNAFGIIMEYMVGGNLDEFLINSAVKEIPWNLRLRIIEELCQALSFLHYFTKVKSIVHGDLKPHNILLTADLHAKLADFGAAQIALSTGSSNTLNETLSKQHTVLYTAPEFLQDITIARTAAMDVYSLSMIIFEVITRTRVFHGITGNISLIISTIINRGQRPDLKIINSIKDGLQQSSSISAEDDLKICNLLDTTMQQCWHQDPSMRPKIAKVRDSLSEELRTVKTGDLLIQIGEVVNLLKNVKLSKPPTMVPLNQFMYPFEIANSRLMSRSHSRNTIKTQVADPCIILFVTTESEKCDVLKYFPASKQFVKLPPLKHDWNDSTAVVLQQCVYVLSSNFVECLNLTATDPNWVRRPAMITPRTHAAAVDYEGKIYIFGGIADENKALSSVECYDPEMESWSTADNLNRHRFGHTVLSACDRKLYCVGGANPTVECYDPLNKEVTDVTETPNRHGFASAYCKGVIYNIGRKQRLRTSVKGSKSQVISYTVDCYNIEDNFWYKGNDLTTNRSQGCACTLGGKIYLIGGWGQLTSCQYIEMYDPKKDKWETVTSMSFGFVQHVCVVE